MMRTRFARIAGGFAAAILSLLPATLLLPGGGSAAAAAPPAPVRSVVLADVNDFVVDSFDAEYELGRDADGRSTLRTVERIVAVFPEFDQNRGIIRDIPRVYDGHDTGVTVVSVTDETGAARPFSTEPYGDFLSVTIAVPEGSYVHGAQSYVIEYEQRDVTRFFRDVSADEFYWDVNGTGWAQPFGRVSARLTLDPGLAEAFNGNAACYRGAQGSGEACELTTEGRTIIAEEQDLGPYENVTIAVGFAPGTFAGQPTPFLERVPLFLYGGFASLAGAIALTAAALIRGLRRPRTGRAIIAQYEPPEGLSAALAAELLRARRKAATATLLDLAVRRRIRLLHHDPSDRYGAQLLDDAGLLPIEQGFVSKVFGASVGTSIGSSVWFGEGDTRLGDAAAVLRSRARTEAKQRGLVRRTPVGLLVAIALLFVAALGLAVIHAVVIGNPVLMTVLLAVGINALVWLLLGIIGGLSVLRPPTPAGAALHEHLMGLREYIRLAEADRIRMLQSASGAEVDEQLIVRVYERLLPYAVLFGFEREWQAELARYYRESSPDWVSGSGSSFSHNLPISAFHSAVSTSPATRSVSSGSGSSFSSSSGGSSGGGFSGGGGGGGGGRGI